MFEFLLLKVIWIISLSFCYDSMLKTTAQIKVQTRANTSSTVPTSFYNIKCTQKGEGGKQREGVRYCERKMDPAGPQCPGLLWGGRQLDSITIFKSYSEA